MEIFITTVLQNITISTLNTHRKTFLMPAAKGAGGMNVYYPYRFQLPYESVAALSQVKSGSGCNFLGYYMYHGGTHPRGKTVPYMNECDVPKFSYDYQAPLGEFGQVRLSYHQLMLQLCLSGVYLRNYVC